MSLIRKHVAVLQAWACLALVFLVLVLFFVGLLQLCAGEQTFLCLKKTSPTSINQSINSFITDDKVHI